MTNSESTGSTLSWRNLGAALLLLLLLCGVSAEAGGKGKGRTEIVVLLEAGADADKEARKAGGKIRKSMAKHGLYQISLPADASPTALAARLKAASKKIRHAEPLLSVQLVESRQSTAAFIGDDLLDEGSVEAQPAFYTIDRAGALLDSKGAGTVVAILDTGVRATHEMMVGHLESGYHFVDEDTNPAETANGIDDDGDGTIDEGAGHGTFLAGLVIALAPEARIMPIRILDDEGRGNSYDLAAAIHHAVDEGADVINLSLELESASTVVEEALDYARTHGVLVVASAGNSGSLGEGVAWPARYAKAMAVTAVDDDDKKPTFASYGSLVSLSAPGVDILGPGMNTDTTYGSWTGTSFSTAMVSAAAALLLATDSTLSPADLEAEIRTCSLDIDSLNPLYTDKIGAGRLDLGALFE